MLIATLIMAALAAILLSIGYFRGQDQHLQGLKAAGQMTLEILPLVVFAFIVAGMAQALVPQGQVSKWIGSEAGFRGVLIGSLAGMLTPGGPFVSMPLAAGFLRAGAGLGTMVAFMVSWSLWGIHRLPLEIGILGWRFTAIRLVSTLIFPPLAGIIASALGKLAKM